MTLTITVDQARERGRAGAAAFAGAGRAAALKRIDNSFHWARTSYLGADGIDLRAELLALSRKRMADDLDSARHPECRGMRELVEAERRAFAEVIDDPFLAAFHFDWYWFCSRRLNTRFVGRTPPPAQCTDVWFCDTREGGPIHASNRDDVLQYYTRESLPPPGRTGGPDWLIGSVTRVGGVSSAVLCDEEPACEFPVNLEWIDHGAADVRGHMAFLERYREFWGPGNQLWVDPAGNVAAVEKANVRMGVRYSRSHGAITACAYLTPDMNAFKKERDLISFQVRGWTADNPDAAYWNGAERRYHRLLELVETEAARGPTLMGAARLILDHDVPFPDRICLAGERGHPDEKLQNWTLISMVRCVSGPNRRAITWLVDPTDPKPVYRMPWHLTVGEGLEHRRAEWEKEIHSSY